MQLRHLLNADFIRDPSALNERVFVLAELTAKLVDALVFVQDLQLFEVEVPLFQLDPLAGVLLDQPLFLLSDFQFDQSSLLDLLHLPAH